MRWINVFTTNNQIEASLVAGLLESEAIKVNQLGTMLSGAIGEIPPDAITITLQVLEVKKKDALQVLKQYKEHRQSEQSNWICHSCGEQNPAAFETCWHCQESR